jgi:hypothetical protein
MVKERNKRTIRQQNITSKELLWIIFILVMCVSLSAGCRNDKDKAEAKSLELERKQIDLERFDILHEIYTELEDDMASFEEGPQFDFYCALNKKQQRAILRLGRFLGSGSNEEALKSIDELVKVLTPGMLINLAEYTQERENILRQNNDLFKKVESYKERARYCYNRLMMFAYDEGWMDTYANLKQAEKHYQFIKKQIFVANRFEMCDFYEELLYDLCAAIVSYEHEQLLAPKE